MHRNWEHTSGVKTEVNHTRSGFSSNNFTLTISQVSHASALDSTSAAQNLSHVYYISRVPRLTCFQKQVSRGTWLILSLHCAVSHAAQSTKAKVNLTAQAMVQDDHKSKLLLLSIIIIIIIYVRPVLRVNNKSSLQSSRRRNWSLQWEVREATLYE